MCQTFASIIIIESKIERKEDSYIFALKQRRFRNIIYMKVGITSWNITRGKEKEKKA